MNIVYYSRWPTYAAYMMAVIHIGICRESQSPSQAILSRHWKLNLIYGKKFGNLIYVGIDEYMNEVYILGCKGKGKMVIRAQKGIGKIFSINEKYHYVDSTKMEGAIPWILSYLQQFPALDKVSKWLFAFWSKRKYPLFLKKVELEKQTLKSEGQI